MAIRLTKAPSHVRVAIRLTPSSFISEWEPFLILFLSPLFQTLDVNLFSGSLVLLTVKVIGRRVGFLIFFRCAGKWENNALFSHSRGFFWGDHNNF